MRSIEALRAVGTNPPTKEQLQTLTTEQLKTFGLLILVQSYTRERVPEDYVRAYGSEVAAYAHMFGSMMLSDPDLTVEYMVEAAELADGPCTKPVIEALQEVRRRMENDNEAFFKWVEVDLV